jgi:putative FmdB family regulatory protein
MPIYEYRCRSCGFEKKYLQKLSDAPITECPSCGKAEMSKLVSAAGFQLKGSGWYVTDFKNSGAGRKDGADKKDGTDNKDSGDKKESVDKRDGASKKDDSKPQGSESAGGKSTPSGDQPATPAGAQAPVQPANRP